MERAQKERKELALYDRIGIGYDTTRRADPYILSRLLAHLSPSSGQRYLDIACGTGNYTSCIAAAADVAVVGVDLSERMISTARGKPASLQRGKVWWLAGDAAKLPFQDRCFAGALCTLAIHHLLDLRAAFIEGGRVIHDGRLVIFTATAEQMSRYWLCRYFPQMMVRAAKQMPSLDRIRAALTEAGFGRIVLEPYSVQRDLADFFLYSGKHRPEVYLDAHVRAGISSFASIATADEMETGCARLARDIEAGRMQEIVAAHDHEGGDYLFVTAAMTVPRT